MKRIITIISVVLLQTMVVAPTFAGGYIQGAFAGQADTFKDIDPADLSSQTAYGGSLAGGYFFTDWLAVQARLGFLDSPADLSGTGISGWQMMYTGGVKIYPFNLGGSGGLLQPYGIAALGGQTLFFSSDIAGISFGDSKTAFLLELGGGLDLMFGDHFGLFGEVTYNYVHFSDVDLTNDDSWSGNGVGWQIGVTFRF